jgi:hypothetical protein
MLIFFAMLVALGIVVSFFMYTFCPLVVRLLWLAIGGDPERFKLPVNTKPTRQSDKFYR